MTAKHDSAPHGRGMAWATLLVSAAISLGVNLWHAFDQAPNHEVTPWFASLAALYGVAPVVLAAFQSHSAAFVPMGRVKRFAVCLLVLLGMVLSVQAQAAAVEIFAGPYLKWVFPVLVDLSAFMALHTLMESAARSGAANRAVPEQAPVPAPARDAEPVPVRADGPAAVPAVPVQPLEAPAPDRVPAPPAPVVPVQTAGTSRPVPAPRTAPVPAERTAGSGAVRSGTDRPGTADLTSAKAGDAAALERMDRAFAGQDPTTVSVRQVRKVLGAGHQRADRLLTLWVARTGEADRSGAPGGGADREGGPDGEGEADRTGERVTVPA